MLNLDWHFFPVFDRFDPATAYPGSYNLGLVATSLAIAILAAFVALSISGRIVAARMPGARYAWASAGAISMGGGIWSMHFIGMLAFSLPCGITYDPVGTLLSMIPGMLASGVALIAISKPDGPSLSRLCVSAVLIGVGIAAMHYSGMAAMRPEALLRYNSGLVAISMVVAVVLAFVSLSIRFRLHHPQSSRMAETIIAASVMGCAIAGMHYTAMEASIFFPLPDAPTRSMALSPTLLALLITIFTVLIAVTTLLATFAGRQSELALSLSAEISQRKRTQEDLRRSEVYLAEAQRLSHTGSWAFRPGVPKPLYWSDEMFRIWGFDPEQGPPDNEATWQRIHPEDRKVVAQEQMERALAGTLKVDVGIESRIILPDGTLKYVHRTCHPVFDGRGHIIEYIGTTVDVTARKHAEEALRNTQMELTHANRVAAMGQLTASIAHEVNQPITAARNDAASALRFLSRKPPDLEEVREALECVVSDSDRAGDIINRIRAQVKKSPPRNASFDINKAINELIALTRSEVVEKRVTVRSRFAEGLSSVRGDRVQLQQVILNLILNAVEAMSSVDNPPRELSISTERAGADEILVAVRDSGPGIDPEYRERVFDSFYTTKPSGMGLGLSICRSIVEAHGGRLWADANEPRGAAFQFTLPTGKEDS